MLRSCFPTRSLRALLQGASGYCSTRQWCSTADHVTFRMLLPTEQHTEMLGSALGCAARRGDAFFLFGTLATGKTCLSRGFIRAKANDPTLIVTSPTFTLEQQYECNEEQASVGTEVAEHDRAVNESSQMDVDGSNEDEGCFTQGSPDISSLMVHHIDLYRLGDPCRSQDLMRIGIPSIYDGGICIVEWSERMCPEHFPSHRQYAKIVLEEVPSTASGEKEDDCDRKIQSTITVCRPLRSAAATPHEHAQNLAARLSLAVQQWSQWNQQLTAESVTG